MDWEEVTLKDIAFYRNEKVKFNELSFDSYISTENMISNRGGITLASSLPTTGSSNIYFKTDVLVSNIRPYFKKIWFADKMGACSNDVLVFAIKNEKIDASYLYYQLSTDTFFDYVMSGSNGVKMPRGNKKSIMDYKLLLPPLKIQKKIASILSNYDQLIENNNQRIKLLESMAEEIYKEWFVRFRFPDYEKVESVDGLPFGWEWRDITSISYINHETINLKNAPEQIKYLDIASVNTGSYTPPEILDFGDAPSRARRILRYGDTLFSTVRPNRKTFTLILENDTTLIASTGFAVITPKEIKDFPFIYFSITQQSFVDSVVSKATGATYPAINQKNFEKLQILIPSKSVLDIFSKKVRPILEMKQILLEKNKTLKETRDLLLPRLINGKLT